MNKGNMPLRFIRRNVKKTQREMGEILGKTQGGYSDIENGRQKISGEEIKKICNEFMIDPNIFTTELPETDWYQFMNKPQVSKEKPFENLNINEKSNVALLLMEKERIEKTLNAFIEENEKLKNFIRDHCNVIE
jgi:transcriptional regulator with XRE-family HTH domain